MKEKRVTVYDLKRWHLEANPDSHYFDRATMRFFGQTLRDFRVRRLPSYDTQGGTAYFAWAQSRNIYGEPRGLSTFVLVSDNPGRLLHPRDEEVKAIMEAIR